MKRHGVQSDFIIVEDEGQISRLNSSEKEEALIIGNFQGLFENNYFIKTETTYFHNPYVNRMWSEINVFSNTGL